MAVGEPNYSSSATDAGIVTILDPDGQRWTELTTIELDSPTLSMLFGHSVSLTDTNLLVGAPGYSDSAGAGFLYSISSGVFTLTNTLADGATGDECGTAVALDGVRLIIGCPGASSSAGAVLVYKQANANLQTTLTAPSPEAGDRLGQSVAMNTQLVLAGAPGASSSTGVVLTWVRAGWLFTLEQTVAGNGACGTAIAASDSWIGVGCPTAGSAGQVAVYSVSSATATLYDTLEPADLTVAAGFGSSVGIDGSYLIAGAPANNTGIGGAVWFEHVSAWTESGVLVPETAGTAAAGTTVSVGPYSIATAAPGLSLLLSQTAECAAGTYAAGLTTAECIACDPATPNSLTASMTCFTSISCDTGWYTPDFTTCVEAEAGYYVDPADQTVQVECNNGMYQPSRGQTSCETADPGFYVPATGANVDQVPCGTGRYSAGSGASACTAADAGYYVDDEDRTAQAVCCNGKYSSAAAQPACTTADPEYFVPNDGLPHTAQDPCTGGYHSTAGAAACVFTDCAQGFELVAAVCTECGSGQWAPLAASCRAAGVGYYVADSDHTKQVECNGGEYSDDTGLSQCKVAPPGFYTPPTGAITEPIRCPAGSYAASGQSACTVSGAGYYVNNGDRTQQLPCNSGTYQPDEGETSCLKTPPGTFTGPTGSHAAPIDCGAGEWAGEGQDHCSTADPGYYAPDDDRSAQLACNNGSFSNTTGCTECTACPAGYSTPGDGLPHTFCVSAVSDSGTTLDSTLTLNDSALPAEVVQVTVEGVNCSRITGTATNTTTVVLVTANSTVEAGVYEAVVTLADGRTISTAITIDSDITVPSPVTTVDGLTVSAITTSPVCPSSMASPMGALTLSSARLNAESEVECWSASVAIDAATLAADLVPVLATSSELIDGYNQVCFELSAAGAEFGSTDSLDLKIDGISLIPQIVSGAVCGIYIPGMTAAATADGTTTTAHQAALFFDGTAVLTADVTVTTDSADSLTLAELVDTYQIYLGTMTFVTVSGGAALLSVLSISICLNLLCCVFLVMPKWGRLIKRGRRVKPARYTPSFPGLAGEVTDSDDSDPTESDSEETEDPQTISSKTSTLLAATSTVTLNDCLTVDDDDEASEHSNEVELLNAESLSSLHVASPSPSPTPHLTGRSPTLNSPLVTSHSRAGLAEVPASARLSAVQMAMAEVRRARASRSGSIR
ncbi:FG-GAP repeat [Carpediemonas membranifera]|uniref:FG-GAP repeat n=1 Tax=Carpediemonas membranifera TaxID=201153 RepID=A0A8J6E976_9EUKA|nr:FG-GAP repeat [Carpediemonas membranifera]|eukprot:KAG9392920.1 FG-GAP repeat [Carpediemonas membranifera]